LIINRSNDQRIYWFIFINLNIKRLGSDIQKRIILAVSGSVGFARFNEGNLTGVAVRAVFANNKNVWGS